MIHSSKPLSPQPNLSDKDRAAFGYDSGDEDGDEDSSDPFGDDYDDEDDEDLDPFSNAPPPADNVQHSDPNSFAWCLMRYASIRLAQKTLEKFIGMAGIELPGGWSPLLPGHNRFLPGTLKVF